MPQALAINAIYDIPVGPGRRFSTGNKFGDYILGNWQLNTIFNARSGQNQTVVDSADVANIGNSNTYERGNMIGKPFSGFTKSKNEWFNTAAFAIPAQYTFGNSYRGLIKGQRLINFDSSVIRSFPIWEGVRFEFRAEAFNLFNHPVFGLNEYGSTDLNSPSTFGQSMVNRRTPIENCNLAARLFSEKHKQTRGRSLYGSAAYSIYRTHARDSVLHDKIVRDVQRRSEWEPASKHDLEPEVSTRCLPQMAESGFVDAPLLGPMLLLRTSGGAAKDDTGQSNDGYVGSQACARVTREFISDLRRPAWAVRCRW